MATVITASHVEAEVAAGRRSIVVPAGAVVTPQARDRARELGASFAAPGAPAHTVPPTPATAIPVARPSPDGMPLGGSGLTPETEGWAHPLHAPLYFRRMGQKVIWHKAIQVTFRADPAILREFVPEPLELAGDEVVAGATDHYQPGHGLPVRAASLSVRVRYNGLEGRHSILAIATSDEVMCANREELGMPVILGEARLWAVGNTWWGVGKRGGSEILRISVFPERVVPPDETKIWTGAGPLLLYKKIPSADPDRKPWRQVIMVQSERQGPIVEYSLGRGSVELGPSVWGIHRIKPLEVIRGSFAHFEGGELKTVRCLWEDRPEPVS